MHAAGDSNLKRTTLELGGKSPAIVLDDVDCEFYLLSIYNCSVLNYGSISPWFRSCCNPVIKREMLRRGRRSCGIMVWRLPGMLGYWIQIESPLGQNVVLLLPLVN